MMNKKERHLIVVSVDALVFEDLEYARTLPTFGRLLKEGALIERVRTIYPSLTHPVHASIITGAPAGITGIICNEQFEPGNENAPWYKLLDQIQCDTLLHAAKRAGLTTAVCTWPVTNCRSDVIDYLVPGVSNAYIEGHEDNIPEVFRQYGACDEIMDIIESYIDNHGYQTTHPEIDKFQIHCSVELIKRFKPNILLTHPSYVDSMRHRTGLFGEKVNEAIRETDRWLGMLYQAMCDAGIEETTDFVVLSDHGQLGICRRICPNVFLADAGYIRTNEKGELVSWEAYIKSCGLSGQVYLSRPDDKKLYEDVYALLSHMAEERIYGFEKVFTLEEVKERYGLYGDFSFVIETDGFSSFSESCSRPIVRELKIDDYRFGRATHGHMPEKGPQPPFIGKGYSFKKGVVVPEGNILNHAPTFAKIFGLELPDAVGHVEKAILVETR